MNQENNNTKNGNHTSNYFPRIIREFEDDDEPMYWG